MPHPITEIPNKLSDRLSYATSKTLLYVDYYYFVLQINNVYEFWFNGNHFIESIDKNKMPQYAVDYLEKECPKFIDFYKNKIYDENSKVEWQPNNLYPQTIPKIGNAYSAMIYKIVTEKDYKRNKRIIHLHEDWGNGGMADFETIGEKEVEAFLTLTIFSETHKTIKSIYELDCFKNSKMKNISKTIIGAIAGDVIGSVYEWNNVKTTEFALFTAKSDYTDDTVLTVAIADCILNQKDFSKTVWEYGRKYRGRGYGGNFRRWLKSNNPKPYGSYGNGSAMRVSAVGFAYETLEEVLEIAKETAKITHNHPEGIKGAQATASAVYLANNGKSKKEIKDYLIKTFDYDLDFTLNNIRPTYNFDVTCQGSVPQAIVAFLESTDFENALRLAISIGGDSDTIACITGGISSAFYKEIPNEILEFVSSKLPNEFIELLNRFDEEKMTNA